MTDYDTNSLNQYTAVGPPGSQTSYYYDKNGNLIDVNNGQYVYSYDCENRLIDVNEDGNSVASYSYDYQGRRVSKTVYGSPDMTTKYCYDGDQVIAEYEGESLVRKFVYGPGIDEPICMIDVADGNTVYYYHFDGVGSVIALSDVNRVIVERYSYDVFGEPNRTSDVNNPYFFTGRRYDEETDLYYYRARYYDYYIGRFLQVDPIGYDDNLNVYSYCWNNPVGFVDPMGLIKWSPMPGTGIYHDTENQGALVIRPPDPIERRQIDFVVNHLKSTQDPLLVRTAERLELREYRVDTSLVTLAHERTAGYVRRYAHPNRIYLNPQTITHGFIATGVREGRRLNIHLMDIMIHEDWHLVSTYPAKTLIEKFMAQIFYDDRVHDFINEYRSNIYSRYEYQQKSKGSR